MEIPISTIITFALAVAIGVIYHIFTKVRDQKNNFLRISDDLRKPFIEAKSIFNINVRGIAGGYIIEDIFPRLYSDQSRNIQTIMPHIPSWQRKRLQIAWSEYEKQINSESPYSWFDCANLYKESKDIVEKRKMLISQLDRILFFFDYHNMFSVFRIFRRLLC